jgi:aminopeptidase N
VTRSGRLLTALVLVVALVAAGVFWLRDDAEPASGDGDATSSAEPSEGSTEGSGDGGEDGGDPAVPDELALAQSLPREDSYYPDVGDPSVDSLHHDLTLAWDAEQRLLTGVDVLTFRATADADEFQLDLGEPLQVRRTLLDGAPVEHEHDGKDLVITSPVEEDEIYELEVSYRGTPEPVEAPTTRDDFTTLGWTITPEGEVWTMQEPFGAYTWYPVNDQPADKALYDFTITAPKPFVGIANGLLESRTDGELGTTTTFHTDEPMSSYLTTIAIGDYRSEQQETAGGVPITLWVPRDKPHALAKVRFARDALAWCEEKLGPYPFSTAGILVTDSQSGMETQTMITLGDNKYVLSKPVLVHEFVHQWYGDQTSPTDWRDVWMNEGMTMYLQAVYTDESGGNSLEATMDDYAAADAFLREQSGPPGAYDPDTFGEGNIYYSPALMWHTLREDIGDDAFWAMVRAWPSVHDNANATREQYVDWVEETTGEELSEFFAAWLDGTESPTQEGS